MADLEHYEDTDAFTKAYQRAVEKEISSLHAKGLPAFQCKDGYIIAIYPDKREVRIQKA